MLFSLHSILGPPRRPRLRSAFTLIELLVVIAILAILASILFPVFSRARENARRSSCQSNLKQIGLGMIQYLQDYDEKYLKQVTGPSGSEYTFVRALQPYTKSTQIFICPSAGATVFPTLDDNKDHYWQTPAGDKGTYSMNSLLEGIHTSEIKSSAETAMFNDNRQFSEAGLASAQYAARHFDGLNVAYADGHVKWFNIKRASTDLNYYLF